jgi:hypothetical protein
VVLRYKEKNKMPQKRNNKQIVHVEIADGKAMDMATGEAIPVTEIKSHHKSKEFRIVNAKESNLATGIHINQYKQTSLHYLQNLKDYRDQNMNSIYNQMDICNRIFKWEDVVSTGLDILIDFAVTDFEFTGVEENSKVEAMLKSFTEDLNIRDYYSHSGLFELVKTMAHEWFVSGNLFPAEAWKTVKLDGEHGGAKLPIKIELLNPLHIRTNEFNFLSGGQALFFTMSSNATIGDIRNTNQTLDVFRDIKSLQEAITKNPLFKGSPIVEDSDQLLVNPTQSGVMFELNDERVSHIKRKARHYDAWGIPYLTKAIQAVTYKQKLWQLDLNTIEGMINYITIFKVGSPDPKSEYHIVKKKRLTDFSSVLTNPQGSTTIVWPHDVEVITAGPSGEVLNFEDKYQEANRAIIQALGVPPILIDGSGRGTTGQVAILAMIERLEKVRESIANYVMFIVRKIGAMNSMQEEFDKVGFHWLPTKLRDEKEVKNLLLAFYDRGLLPIQTTLREGGYDAADLVEIKIKEKESEMNELFVRPDIPFAPNPGQQTLNEGRPVDKSKTQDETNVKGVEISVGSDLVYAKYKEDVAIVVAELEQTISEIKRKTKVRVSNEILATAVKLEQISTTVAATTVNDDVGKMIELTETIKGKTEKLRSEATDQIVKIVTQRNSTNRELMLEGSISILKKKAQEYAEECYVEFSKELGE